MMGSVCSLTLFVLWKGGSLHDGTDNSQTCKKVAWVSLETALIRVIDANLIGSKTDQGLTRASTMTPRTCPVGNEVEQ